MASRTAMSSISRSGSFMVYPGDQLVPRTTIWARRGGPDRRRRQAGEGGGSLRRCSHARRADLLPNCLSHRLIDPLLPARSGLLKVIKNVPVNSQRDKLLGVRNNRTLRRELRGLCGCRLERRFSSIPCGRGSSYSVGRVSLLTSRAVVETGICIRRAPRSFPSQSLRYSIAVHGQWQQCRPIVRVSHSAIRSMSAHNCDRCGAERLPVGGPKSIKLLQDQNVRWASVPSNLAGRSCGRRHQSPSRR